MRLRFYSSVACSILGVCAVAALAQDVKRIPAGDASLAGRVLDREFDKPLTSAIVTLTSANGTGVLTTITDTSGQYVFEGLAAGRYRIVALLEGYAPEFSGDPDLQATRGEVISLPQAKHTVGVNLTLRRAGTIAGVVTGAGGRPVGAADVSAMLMLPDGRPGGVMTARTRALTNARGEYTITNVPTGSYIILARWADPTRNTSHAEAPLRPTFFPGTDKVTEAIAVRVSAGEAVGNINVPLVTPEVFRISGHTIRTQSEGHIEANLVAEGQSVRAVNVAEDGMFDIPHLDPGRYTLWLRASTPEAAEAAVMTLDLTTDLTGLSLSLAPTAAVIGRVITVDGSPLPQELRVAAIQADAGKQIDPLERDRAEVTADGRFHLRGLFGERILRVLGLGPEWELDRVLLGKSIVRSVKLESGDSVDDVTVFIKRR